MCRRVQPRLFLKVVLDLGRHFLPVPVISAASSAIFFQKIRDNENMRNIKLIFSGLLSSHLV
jgi:hypothetical protein